jgi:hypothetical protein
MEKSRDLTYFSDSLIIVILLVTLLHIKFMFNIDIMRLTYQNDSVGDYTLKVTNIPDTKNIEKILKAFFNQLYESVC